MTLDSPGDVARFQLWYFLVAAAAEEEEVDGCDSNGVSEVYFAAVDVVTVADVAEAVGFVVASDCLVRVPNLRWSSVAFHRPMFLALTCHFFGASGQFVGHPCLM